MSADISYHVEARTLTEQPTAVARARLPVDGIGRWLPGAYEAIMTYLDEVGIAPVGPPFARYTFHGITADVEAGLPVAEPVTGRGRVVPAVLPGGTVAVTTHYGPYEGLVAAYDAVAGWMKEHDRQPDGPHWEVYYTDPSAEPDPARWRTDLVAPCRAG